MAMGQGPKTSPLANRLLELVALSFEAKEGQFIGGCGQSLGRALRVSRLRFVPDTIFAKP